MHIPTVSDVFLLFVSIDFKKNLILEPWESIILIINPFQQEKLSLNRLNGGDLLFQSNLNKGDISSQIILNERDVSPQICDIIALWATITTCVELTKKRIINFPIFWKIAQIIFYIMMSVKQCGKLFLNMMMLELRIWVFYESSWMS